MTVGTRDWWASPEGRTAALRLAEWVEDQRIEQEWLAEQRRLDDD